MAGLRIATVSTVALTTVGAIVGYGGLGNLIYEGMHSFFKAQVLTASVLCVLLAVVADLLLLGLQRLLTPWARRRTAEDAARYGGREPRRAPSRRCRRSEGGVTMGVFVDAWTWLTTGSNWAGGEGVTAPARPSICT